MSFGSDPPKLGSTVGGSPIVFAIVHQHAIDAHHHADPRVQIAHKTATNLQMEFPDAVIISPDLEQRDPIPDASGLLGLRVPEHPLMASLPDIAG